MGRRLAGAAIAVALIATACLTLLGSEHGTRDADAAAVHVTIPGTWTASPNSRHSRHRPGSRRHGRRRAGDTGPGEGRSRHRTGGGQPGWLHDPADPMPAGVRPGPGRPTPRILSPARELADVGRLPAGWRASMHVLSVGGLTRSYLVVAPVLATAPVHSIPLYLALHGRGATPDVMAHLTDLEARTGPAVVVYPAGYEDSWNAGGCCGYAHADGVDDVEFVHDLVTQVLADYPAASPLRVFAVGFSNGGRMTYRLACQLPGTFAGIAAVEAVPVYDCRRLRPLDVEIIAQRSDPLLSISDESARKTVDGYLEPTVSSAVTDWRGLDGCDPYGTTRRVDDATQQTWACRDGTDLQYTLYPGGAHRWPQGGRDRPSGDRIVLSLLISARRHAAL